MLFLNSVVPLDLIGKKLEPEILLLPPRVFIRKKSPAFHNMTCYSLTTLNLGSIVEISGVGLASVLMVTDNPLYPVFNADLRLFTGGFVIERIDRSPLPLLISMKSHVEVMWTVDMRDAYNIGSRLLEEFHISTSPEDDSLDGVFVILKLKNFFDPDDSSVTGFEKCIQYELWNRIFPTLSPTGYIAFMVPSHSRSASPFNSAHHSWRDFARLYDIPDIRGVRDDLHLTPDALFLSFHIALNKLELKIGENPLDSDFAETKGISSSTLHGYLAIR